MDLFFFTGTFPYGYGEAFIESEIPIMAKYFDNIYIINQSKTTDNKRELPGNVRFLGTVDRKRSPSKKEKRKRITPLAFKFSVWKELFGLLKEPKLFKLRFKELIHTYDVATHMGESIEKIVSPVKQQFKNGVIYSYWFTPIINTTLSEVLKKKNIITRVHGGDLFEDRTKLNYFPFRKKLITNALIIGAASGFGRRYLLEKHPVSKKKCTTYYLGTKGVNLKEKTTSEYDLSIASCAFIKPLKRISLTANAIVELASKNPNKKIIWYHIGGGDENIIQEINDLSKTKNLTIQLLGNLSQKELNDFYENTHLDVFISTSSTEGGVPVSMMEAISYGIPLIGTKVGGIPEIVNEKTGVLLNENPSIIDISNALEKFFDKDYQQKKSEEARLLWEENFNALKNHTRFYNDILSLLKNN